MKHTSGSSTVNFTGMPFNTRGIPLLQQCLLEFSRLLCSLSSPVEILNGAVLVHETVELQESGRWQWIDEGSTCMQPTHHVNGGHSSNNASRKHVLWVVEIVADARESHNEGPQKKEKD